MLSSKPAIGTCCDFADSSILRVIRDTAHAWSAKGVRLLDLDATCPASVFVDHVHLDLLR